MYSVRFRVCLRLSIMLNLALKLQLILGLGSELGLRLCTFSPSSVWVVRYKG